MKSVLTAVIHSGQLMNNNCTCEVAGTNGQWYVDVYGEYRCDACDGVLSPHIGEDIE